MEPINARDFNEAIGNNLKKGIALTVSIPSSIIGQQRFVTWRSVH